MVNAFIAVLDLLSITGWIFIGISSLMLKDIMQEAKYEHHRLQWRLMYLILPLLLAYPSFLFYQYIYGGDIPLSKRIITVLIILLAIGCLLLLYLAHQIRSMQLKREISGVAASILVVYLGLSVYLSFQIADFTEVLNNLLFSTSMFMLSLALFYLGNYTLEFSKVVKIAPKLYIAGVFILLPGIIRAFLVEKSLFNLVPYESVLKAVGTLGIMICGILMFAASDQFKRRVLEFQVRIK